jgi:hypothetical protein
VETLRVPSSVLVALQWVGAIWPGCAILGCSILNLRRRTCAFLAAAYLLDAALVGLLVMTNERLQFVWLVTDTTLAAALAVPILELAWTRCVSLCGMRTPLAHRPIPVTAATGATPES